MAVLRVYQGTWDYHDVLVYHGEWLPLPFQYYEGTWQPTEVLGQKFNSSTVLNYHVEDPTPLTRTYTETKSFAIAWGQTYRGNGTQRTDNKYLYQGYNVASNGNMRSLIGFNVSAPAGAECLSATLTLYANHWYYNSGGTLAIGTHNKTSKPSTYSSTGVNADRLRETWTTKTGQRSINLGTAIGQEFLSGSTKGIILGPGPSTGSTYYGYFSSEGGYKPVLTIKYRYTA